MEQKCSNCTFYDLDVDVFPCADCSRYLSNNKDNYWMADPENITDSLEMLRAILKTQTYTMIEIGRLRKELDKM